MKKRGLYFLVLLLILLFVYSPSFYLTLIGKILIKTDPLAKSNIIIVLAGERGERVRYGVLLYQQGYAKKVLFSGGPIVDFPGGAKVTWAGLMKSYAIRLGLPEKDITVQNKSRSTQEDAMFSFRLLQDSPPSSVILVTSPYHSKRAFKIFKHVFKDIKVHSVPVAKSWYDANTWWKSSKGRYQVAREYFAFFVFYLESIGRKLSK